MSDSVLILLEGEVAAASLRAVADCYADSSEEAPVTVLCLNREVEGEEIPGTWRRLDMRELLDLDALRREFLAFLEAWPRKPLAGGKSFDEIFRLQGGYSVWWVGPGLARHPDRQVFRTLCSLWLADRAIRTVSPAKVLILASTRELARVLASRCRREGRAYGFLPGSVLPGSPPWLRQGFWLTAALVRLVLSPLKAILRAGFARLLAHAAAEPSRAGDERTVVLTSAFPRHVRRDGARASVWFWQELVAATAATGAKIRMRYLLRTLGGRHQNYRMVSWMYHTGWHLLRRLDGAMPIPERNVALGAWVRALPNHLASLFRYARLERTSAFRNSFDFSGADVSCLYVPRLRRELAHLASWAREVGAVAKLLETDGQVGAMVVTEEMYRWGMINIAAARQVGVPTVGCQHGTIFPMHLMYTPPPGQIERAPTPDYLAVYSPYAKEVVSRHGAFPRARVWITGSPRFDHLVRCRHDKPAARGALGVSVSKKVILLATQYYPWFREAARALFEAVAERADCVVCVKTHPRDVPLDIYRRLAGSVGAQNVCFFDDRFDELLTACDVLVSGSSTTVLEAILLGKRAICVNMSGEPDRYPYVAAGGALAARSPTEIRVALERALMEEGSPEAAEARRRFLLHHAGPSAEGQAAATLAKRICELVRAGAAPLRHGSSGGRGPAGTSG